MIQKAIDDKKVVKKKENTGKPNFSPDPEEIKSNHQLALAN